MPRIFAYIIHRGGVVDDSASELLAAARKIDAFASPTAIVVGYGCGSRCCLRVALRSTFGEIWKIANEALAYPNAEVVRAALVSVLPPGIILLVPHDHFGIDLGPWTFRQAELRIRLRCAGNRWGRRQFSQTGPAGIRRTSQHACPLRHLFGSRDQHPSGSVQSRHGHICRGVIVDKSSAIGTLAARRRYLETIVAEAGDVDITKHSVLVSVGRGIQEKDNIALAEELAEALGRGGKLFTPRR